jgi:hypothetical protein
MGTLSQDARYALHQHASFSEPFSYPMYVDLRDQATTVAARTEPAVALRSD